MHWSREDLAAHLFDCKHVHFIGITSPFCSFTATYLLSKGIKVTASEASQDSDAAKKWIEKGVLFVGGHNAGYITEDVDLVIFPNGIIPGNPEVEKTTSTNKPYVLVQELLGIVSNQYKTIAIAGTHGKTTTTALVIWLLHKTVGTPNFIIGDAKDKIAELNSNWESHPESEYLVIEACEYKRQFLDRAPNPYISVVTHIDLDHTDYYPTQKSYNQAFLEFLMPTTNTVIIDHEGANEKLVLAEYLPKTQANILEVSKIRAAFGHIVSPLLFGPHNQENLLRTAGVGLAIGLTSDAIRNALQTFPGVSSRFEYKGETKKGTAIYKDFAHNPQKITSCLLGAKEAFPQKKLIVAYQPHNFERTFTFKDELVKALSLADVIIVPNIYSLREGEQERSLISSQSFVESISQTFPDKQVVFTNDTTPYEKTLAEVKKFDDAANIIIIVSAGDLDRIIPQLLG